MKTITNVFLVLILFGTSTHSTLAAENPKAVGHRVAQDISKWDANQNGRLDGDEMAAFQRDKVRERQAQQEARAKAAIEARKLDEAARFTRMVPPSQIKQYDANANGLIDLDEWKVYRADVARRIAEKRAARLDAATNSTSPSTIDPTNTSYRP